MISSSHDRYPVPYRNYTHMYKTERLQTVSDIFVMTLHTLLPWLRLKPFVPNAIIANYCTELFDSKHFDDLPLFNAFGTWRCRRIDASCVGLSTVGYVAPNPG